MYPRTQIIASRVDAILQFLVLELGWDPGGFILVTLQTPSCPLYRLQYNDHQIYTAQWESAESGLQLLSVLHENPYDA